jgi:hypothetical protein
MPDIVKKSSAVLKQDKPITLIDIITKHFRHSANNDDKMLTQNIVSIIVNCGYTDNIDLKKLASAFIQCKIGNKPITNITIGDKRGKGYTNIIYIQPEKNDDDDDDE